MKCHLTVCLKSAFSLCGMQRTLTAVSTPSIILEVILITLSQSSATVELGATAALLVTEVLTGVRSEETNVLGVLTGAVELRMIVGLRKWLLLSNHRIREDVEEL